MNQPNNTHADDVYNRALLKLYRAAIEAGLRAEAEEAKQIKTDAPQQIEAGRGTPASFEGFELTRQR